MMPDSLRRAIAAWVQGETDPERCAMDLAGLVLREDVGLVRTAGGTRMLALSLTDGSGKTKPPEKSGASLTTYDAEGEAIDPISVQQRRWIERKTTEKHPALLAGLADRSVVGLTAYSKLKRDLGDGPKAA